MSVLTTTVCTVCFACLLESPVATQGFAVGLEAIGGQCVFASEVAPRSVALYQRNFPHTAVAGDIWAVDVETEIPPHDILVGGFPCQPFSAVSALRPHGCVDVYPSRWCWLTGLLHWCSLDLRKV